MEQSQIQPNSVYKYSQIKQLLLQDIHSGKYIANTKIPSLKKIMEQHDVSFSTAARVIYELVKEGTVYTVPSKGCFVADSQSNDKHINIMQSESKRIIFIVPGITTEAFNLSLKGILDVVQSKSYRTEIYHSEGDYNKETQLLGKCLEEPIAGLIFMPSFYGKSYNHLFQMQNRNIPIALLLRYIEKNNFDYTGTADTEGVKKAVKYLISLGHKRIVFLSAGFDKDISTVKERLEGYKQALKEKNIKINENLIKTEYIGITLKESIHKHINKLITDKINFSAIFAIHDDIAEIAYQALKEKNIKVPDDVSLIGFGNYLQSTKNFEVPLTTVDLDIYHSGYYAAKLLMKRIEENKKTGVAVLNKPENTLVKTKLIIRKSVKKIN